MSENSIESEFKFISYKIGAFQFRMEKAIGLLLFRENFDPEKIDFRIAVHPPLYFKSKQIYICGLSCQVFLNQPKEKASEPGNSEATAVESKADNVRLFELSASIDGVFQTKSQTRFPVELEDTLVKLQAPTILFPFLRSSIVSFFADAGFGSVIMPLVNVTKIAEMQKDKLVIKEM